MPDSEVLLGTKAKRGRLIPRREERDVNRYDELLLGLPSVTECEGCAVCGAPANNQHHVIYKGMGGSKMEKLIPTVKLCGSGTTGCHGKVHQHLIHLYWDVSKGGWVYYITPEPMNDFRCWEEHGMDYMPLRGWAEQKECHWLIGGHDGGHD